MLTTKRWEKVREDERCEGAAAPGSGVAARRLDTDRWRAALQEFMQILEAGVASAAVVGLFAATALLLMRALAT